MFASSLSLSLVTRHSQSALAMVHFKIVKQETKPIDGQKPGTSGLRKKVWLPSQCHLFIFYIYFLVFGYRICSIEVFSFLVEFLGPHIVGLRFWCSSFVGGTDLVFLGLSLYWVGVIWRWGAHDSVRARPLGLFG